MIFYLQLFFLFICLNNSILELLVVIEYFHSSATVCCNNKNIIIPWYEGKQASEQRMRRKEIFMITLIRKYNYDYMRPFGRFMTLLTYMCICFSSPHTYHILQPYPKTSAWASAYWYFMAFNYFMRMCQKWDEYSKWRDFYYFASSAWRPFHVIKTGIRERVY